MRPVRFLTRRVEQTLGMVMPLRINLPGAWHHLVGRGNGACCGGGSLIERIRQVKCSGRLAPVGDSPRCTEIPFLLKPASRAVDFVEPAPPSVPCGSGASSGAIRLQAISARNTDWCYRQFNVGSGSPRRIQPRRDSMNFKSLPSQPRPRRRGMPRLHFLWKSS